MNLTTSKTKQFCKTSSIFELDNIKNAAILRDLLQKWKVACRADGLVPLRFAMFPVHLSKVLRLPRKIDARSYEVLHLSLKIILVSAPTSSLMNMSLAPRLPWKMHLCRSSSNVPHACHCFWTCYKAPKFCSLLTRCTVLVPATQNDASTSKSGANMACFVHFDLEMCFAPQRRALFRHLNFQKSKSAPTVRCFVHFDLEMCFAPQRRALFRHLNVQRYSEPLIF